MSRLETARIRSARDEVPPVTHLQLQVTARTPDSVTVRLDGELDLATADLLDAVLCQQVGGRRLVRLDLDGLSFVDCAGLRPIVVAASRLRGRRGQLVLTHGSPRHARLLRLAGLEHVLPGPEEEPGHADGGAYA